MVEADWSTLAADFDRVLQKEAVARLGRLGEGETEAKSAPDDLVTAADLAVEREMTPILGGVFPGAVILGEEAEAADPDFGRRARRADRMVALDPIDGTFNFAHGLPLFGGLVGVADDGRPVGGLLLDPMRRHGIVVWDGALWDWTPGDLRPFAAPDPRRSDILSGYVPLSMFEPADRAGVAASLSGIGTFTSLRCSCHEYRQLVLGGCDYVISRGLKPWDHVAGIAAVEARGGTVRLISGEPYTTRIGRDRATMIAAKDEETWERVAAALEGRPGSRD